MSLNLGPFVGRRYHPWDNSRVFDERFGHHLTEKDLLDTHDSHYLRRNSVSPKSGPEHRARSLSPDSSDSDSEQVSQQVSIFKDKFEVMIDVSHFEPEEITVKTVGNGIIVNAEHEERADHLGSISRQFSRKYLLPAHIDPLTVTSNLSYDRILTIQAKKHPKSTDGVRDVPISVSSQSPHPQLQQIPV